LANTRKNGLIRENIGQYKTNWAYMRKYWPI